MPDLFITNSRYGPEKSETTVRNMRESGLTPSPSHAVYTAPSDATYALLLGAMRVFNDRLFEGKLPATMLMLVAKHPSRSFFRARRFGDHEGHHADVIGLNPAYFTVLSPLYVLSLIAREQVQQWQQHFGELKSRDGYYNHEWATKMELIGLRSTKTGLPGGAPVGQHVSHFILPGGLFSHAGIEILEQPGVQRMWLDRYPPAPALPQDALVDGASGAGVRAARGWVAMVEHVDPGLQEQVSRVALTPPARAGFEVAPVVRPSVDPDSAKRGRDELSGNRQAYMCPQCRLKVWGKPRIRVSCMDCGDLPLKPVSTRRA